MGETVKACSVADFGEVGAVTGDDGIALTIADNQRFVNQAHITDPVCCFDGDQI